MKFPRVNNPAWDINNADVFVEVGIIFQGILYDNIICRMMIPNFVLI